MNILKLIGRQHPIFFDDIKNLEVTLADKIKQSKFLIIGAAGSIGQAVTLELFKRDPKLLHAVDISENNMVELVRTLRSSIGYGSGEFKTFALDCGSKEFEIMCDYEGPYDYIFNLSALKHVRSESDPFTLMRLINVNIFNTMKTIEIAKKHGVKNYFCVSTDKAANPVNMMGASKRIMESFLMRESLSQCLSMARFANVAFSDGSLLHGFNQRIIKRQPISAPFDVRRYFLTPQESGELCMFAGLFGKNRDIFFPKLNESLHLETFSNIATRFLQNLNYEPYMCESEDEARAMSNELINKKKWPVYFFKSNTTGEKDFEEFFTEHENLNLVKYKSIGIIKNKPDYDENKLTNFCNQIDMFYNTGNWTKHDLVELFKKTISDFDHKETGKYLDNRM